MFPIPDFGPKEGREELFIFRIRGDEMVGLTRDEMVGLTSRERGDAWRTYILKKLCRC